ncbi:TLC domain-containing protein 1-like [Trichomycterus rosablanca]|uniref:TLC domain-containing protein 1-like n=1 Tax=Trichomycterus rosablanca TaxID=2290929 RepID=UPI002F35F0DD
MEGMWHQKPGVSVLVFSFMFRVVHHLLRKLPLPKVVERDELRSWKWRNLSVSLVHSLLTGPWAIMCVSLWPEMLSDIYSNGTPVSYLLVCVSSGYFLQDVGDIIFSGHARGSWEFLLHHFLVLWVFLYVLYSQKYIAGAAITLLVEINSTTLHARLLLKLAGAQSSRLYHINKLLNLFTYVAFRLLAQFYITYHVVRDYHWLDLGIYFLFTVLLMDIMILIYFYRLLRADFFPRRKGHPEQNGTQHNSFSHLLDE